MRLSFGEGMFVRILFVVSIPTASLTIHIKSTRSYYRGLTLSVFSASTGNCTGLSCLKQGVYSSDSSSYVSFKALSQITYYIIVSDDRVRVGHGDRIVLSRDLFD